MSDFNTTEDFFNDIVENKPANLPKADELDDDLVDDGSESDGPKRPRAKSRTEPEAKADMDFIIEHISTMSYDDMADTLKISKNQVNRYVQDARTGLRDRAKELAKTAGKEAYGTKELKSKKDEKVKIVVDYSKPLTNDAKKVESIIKEKLSRPKREGMGATKQTVKNQVDTLLSQIGLGA